MFKFVAICAFLAVATASPGTIISSPFTYSAGIAPAVATYNAAGSFYNPAPIVYSSPLSPLPYPGNYVHLIKKRSPSPQFIVPSAAYPSYAPYSAPLAATYATAPVTYSSPLAATYGSPYLHSASVFPAAHLIKKRSAPLLSAPVLSAYSAAPVVSSYSASPFVSTYSAAPYVSTYSAYPAAAPVVSASYYPGSPLAYAQFIKK